MHFIEKEIILLYSSSIADGEQNFLFYNMYCLVVFLRRLNCSLGSVGGPAPMTSPLAIFRPWAV